MNNLYIKSDFNGYNTDFIYKEAEKQGFIKNKDIELVKGIILKTLNNFLKNKPGFRISLLYMDLDVENPTYFVLKTLIKYIIPGSIIFLMNII